MTTATLTRDLIVAQTRALKLPGIARGFEALARQARDAHWPHEEYLHEILTAEQTSRHESVIRQRLHDAMKAFASCDKPSLFGNRLRTLGLAANVAG